MAVIAGVRPLQHRLVAYRRTWRASAFSTILAPILFLTAMGIGLGSFVGTTAGFGGVSYLAFLAPGLLAAQAMQTATQESSWPVLAGFKWQKTFEAAIATPQGPRDIALGHLYWLVVRLGIVTGVFLMTRAALPHLLAGTGKAVINIVSVAGLRAYGATGYGAAKAALIHLTRELALTYGDRGLRVNAVAPGHIRTPMVEKLNSEEDWAMRRSAGALSHREGDAWDIAQAAVFLASEDAGFITGVCLPVDGGASEIGALAAMQRQRRASA